MTTSKKTTAPAGDVTVRILDPVAGSGVWLFVNRFLLEDLENNIVMHFALLNDNNSIFGRYSCIMSMDHIRRCEPRTKDYLSKLGAPEDEEYDPSFQIPSQPSHIDVAKIINLAHSGNEAEIIFSTYILRDVIHRTHTSQGVPEINSTGIAVLTCGLEFQRRFTCDLLSALNRREDSAE